MAASYALVGKRVRVQLYDRSGRLLGAIAGRVADVSEAVPVGKDAAGNDIKKDLAYVVGIEPLQGPDGETVPYKNSAGAENESWFAVQDLEVIAEPDEISKQGAMGSRLGGLSLN